MGRERGITPTAVTTIKMEELIEMVQLVEEEENKEKKKEDNTVIFALEIVYKLVGIILETKRRDQANHLIVMVHPVVTQFTCWSTKDRNMLLSTCPWTAWLSRPFFACFCGYRSLAKFICCVCVSLPYYSCRCFFVCILILDCLL